MVVFDQEGNLMGLHRDEVRKRSLRRLQQLKDDWLRSRGMTIDVVQEP